MIIDIDIKASQHDDWYQLIEAEWRIYASVFIFYFKYIYTG